MRLEGRSELIRPGRRIDAADRAPRSHELTHIDDSLTPVLFHPREQSVYEPRAWPSHASPRGISSMAIQNCACAMVGP